MRTPTYIVHRRNRIDQLQGLPFGCWIELDIELYEGRAYLTHDPLPCAPSAATPKPDAFEDFVPAALAAGVRGFVVDCKRENCEKFVLAVFEKNGVTASQYCFLNEMEVQADIFQSLASSHQNCMRVWEYRSAQDVIDLVRDAQAVDEAHPQYIWVDCWRRGLLTDITKAHVPMNGEQAKALQDLGVKLVICSPELYIHKYDTAYTPEQMAVFYAGVIAYRRALATAGVTGDLICTKFAGLWAQDLASVTANGSVDYSAYAAADVLKQAA